MSAGREIDRYVAELAAALQARGAARRRFLRECRDHLLDAAADRGEQAAVATFGEPRRLAAAFDAEVAARRGLRATLVTGMAVCAMAGSTLALLHSASPGATAPVPWRIVFFLAAQLAGLAAFLAVVQAVAARSSGMPPPDVALLARRNGCALVAAGATLFAAGAALPGRGSAVLLLAGPALSCLAAYDVLRTRGLARRLDGGAALTARPPLDDLARLLRIRRPALDDCRLLALTTLLAMAASFARDRAEQGSLREALTTAGVEAVAVVAGYAALGRRLGLRRA